MCFLLSTDVLSDAENQFLAEPASGLLNAAKKVMEENGSLEQAALLCEAAIQKGELGSGGYEAWILLGQARSMDEREGQALKALIEGTRIAQAGGNFQVGMLVRFFLVKLTLESSVEPVLV